MQIIDFTHDHIAESQKLALQNYEEERGFVPALPEIGTIPDLSEFADNMGVVAFEGNKMMGYLCAYLPHDNVFGTTNVKGTWSPIHAHATVSENRSEVYKRLYQAAAKKWISTGIVSHAITLYSHDKIAHDALFQYGFGLRCVDSICMLGNKNPSQNVQYQCSEIPRSEAGKIADLRNLLIGHLGQSHSFMHYPQMSEQDSVDRANQRKSRIFIVADKEQIIGFIEVMESGENFVCDTSDMMNICGAYLMPDYRSKGVFNNFMVLLMHTLKKEGYARLGVDFESFNPTAYGFWLKHFEAYTHSVVRRIDERGNV